jgi:hypothetical protein
MQLTKLWWHKPETGLGYYGRYNLFIRTGWTEMGQKSSEDLSNKI